LLSRRVRELERLRKGVFRPSSKGMVAALDRLADLIALGGQDLDVSMVPQRRVIGLATYGLSSKAPLLAGTPRDSLNVIDVVQLQRGEKCPKPSSPTPAHTPTSCSACCI
jgi:hypothetical protein